MREYLASPFPEGELTKYATSCATPEIKLTGVTRPVNATHELLLEYARTRATTAPSGTIRQFTEWWEFVTGYLIPERTFQRHTSVLRKMGLVDVRYSRDEFLINRTWYNLIGVGLVMPSMTVADGVIGFEAHRDRAEEEHQRAMATLADIDPDQLQAEWCGESCCSGLNLGPIFSATTAT
jgi:hypothetical protein